MSCVHGAIFSQLFRPETLEFLPELRQSTHHSTCGELAFLYLDKAPFQSRYARPVKPVCSLFLQRGTSGPPNLKEIPPEDVLAKLRGCLLFCEDAAIEAQITAVLTALASRPAYFLQYDSDPNIAARVIKDLLREKTPGNASVIPRIY
jgi:hypothetical protein